MADETWTVGQAEGQPSGGFWRRLGRLDTAVIVALIGGLVTVVTLANSYLVARVQAGQAVHERELAEQARYLERRVEVVKSSLDLVGAAKAASDDLLTISSREWDPEAFAEGEGRDQVVGHRGDVREFFNRIDARWRAEKDSLGFQLAYYHDGDPRVMAAWRKLAGATSHYMDCSRKWLLSHPKGSDSSQACAAEIQVADAEMDDLLVTLAPREHR